MTRTVVMWFRRDLRLADHRALEAAAADGQRVVALFVVDPAFARSGAPRRAFMAAALHSLNDSVGGALVYRCGRPHEVLPALAKEVGAAAVYATRDHAPYGRDRDAAVAAALRAIDVALVGVDSNYAVMPGTVRKGDGTPYAVFTPFSRAWRAHGWETPQAAPDVRWLGTPAVASEAPPATTTSVLLPPATEAAQHERWEAFLPEVRHYRECRDLPALDGTSRLSAALRWGLVHPRQLLAELQSSPGDDTFGSELGWREFYADVLLRAPDSGWHNVNSAMDAMPVDTDAAARDRFQRWAVGTTGYPIIDAGMRQLLTTGWMHNRVRMLVGSFLVKDLHLPWQWGARHFLGHLVDGDLASNSHGWQWVAGTGTDASPYFRIFNPTTQALRFDPDGEYVRRWVPELATIGGGAVHDLGLLRPEGYPAPMVDHAAERDEAMARYRSSRAGSR
ncbi:MAG: deoxyribodipyrimidine photo-lyase [Actinomycetota bacterium]|nr:deoxyribodipyrimidine photo-lyase [Actinomycetota bacterium]